MVNKKKNFNGTHTDLNLLRWNGDLSIPQLGGSRKLTTNTLGNPCLRNCWLHTYTWLHVKAGTLRLSMELIPTEPFVHGERSSLSSNRCWRYRMWSPWSTRGLPHLECTFVERSEESSQGCQLFCQQNCAFHNHSYATASCNLPQTWYRPSCSLVLAHCCRNTSHLQCFHRTASVQAAMLRIVQVIYCHLIKKNKQCIKNLTKPMTFFTILTYVSQKQ